MGAEQQGATATDGRWLVIPRTLSFVFSQDDVLLMKRSPHRRVFPNQYNGLGGHIERDEDPYTAALREIREECGLPVHHLTLRAVHQVDTAQSTGILLFVFTAETDERALQNTSDEGTLHWVPLKSLAEYDLVEDLPLILPQLAASRGSGNLRFAHVSYDAQDQIVMRYAELL